MCSRLLASLVLLGCIYISFAASAVGDTAAHAPPTPMPSAKGCTYFARLLPVSQASFQQHHLTDKQRSYILKYVRQMPAKERPYAKWVIDHDADDGIIVLSAMPIVPDSPNGSHAAWTAVNTNVAFDPVECREIIMPVAERGDVSGDR